MVTSVYVKSNYDRLGINKALGVLANLISTKQQQEQQPS